MTQTALRAKLISVAGFLAEHPDFKSRDTNYAICWKDALAEAYPYLVNPKDVDADGECCTFYYQYLGTKKPQHPLIGSELARRAEKITEVEPGLFKLEFS